MEVPACFHPGKTLIRRISSVRFQPQEACEAGTYVRTPGRKRMNNFHAQLHNPRLINCNVENNRIKGILSKTYKFNFFVTHSSLVLVSLDALKQA